MRTSLKLFVSLLFLTQLATNTKADFVTYQLTGEIPVGATITDPNVSIGDIWTANFIVDTSTPGIILDATETAAGYIDAVVGGFVEFSGGYIPDIDLAGFDINVFNDTPSGNDAISFGAALSSGDLSGSIFQSLTANDEFSSLDLPDVGASLTPTPSSTVDDFFQLTLVSDNGFVEYTSSLANNVSFIAVPEPVSTLWIGLASLAVCLRRTRNG